MHYLISRVLIVALAFSLVSDASVGAIHGKHVVSNGLTIIWRSDATITGTRAAPGNQFCGSPPCAPSSTSNAFFDALDATKANFQAHFSSNTAVTITVDVNYQILIVDGSNFGNIGAVNASSSFFDFLGQLDAAPYGYTSLRTAIAAKAITTNAVNAIASWPGTFFGDSSCPVIPEAQALQLGMSGSYHSSVGGVALNGLSEGILEHEVSEVMGRVGGNGDFISACNGSGFIYLAIDMYAWKNSDSTRARISNNTFAYFSIDGGTTHLKDWFSGSGGDSRDWNAADDSDACNEAGSFGNNAPFTAIDFELMDVIGWQYH